MRPETRFVTDASLEQLARRLRFLGYDVVTHRGARLEELFDAARGDGRTVLTRSARHPRRYADVAALQLGGLDLAAALQRVAHAHAPSGSRWSRCPRCNSALHSRSAFEAHGEVPGRVVRRTPQFAWCPGCGQWFWPGSHVARLEAWFAQVLGQGPPPAGPSAHGPVDPGR